MKIKKGDKVVVITGKDKGKTGKVLKTFPSENKLNVEKVNMHKKFQKKNTQGPGKIIENEGRMDASNVMLVDPKSKKRTRVGYRILEDGKKVRIAKKSNEVLN